MISIKQTVAYISIVAVFSISTSAAGKSVCQNLPEGRWRVVAYQMPADSVVAVSDVEAKAVLGKQVIIGKNFVRFPNTGPCRIISTRTERTRDYKNYPLAVEFNCANDVVVPAFFIGKRCNKILAALDGPTYELNKIR